MNRWKGSSNPQTYWRSMQANWVLTKPSCPFLWSGLFERKKRGRVSSNTPSAWVSGWCWYSVTLFPPPVLSITKMPSSLSLKYHHSQPAPGCSKFLFLFSVGSVQASLSQGKKCELREEMVWKGACSPLAMINTQLFWDCKVMGQRRAVSHRLPNVSYILYNYCIPHI